MIKSLNPKEMKSSEVQKWLQGGIGPRPVAFVSTISIDGIKNLAPFSFYNVFSSNPPVIGFSPARRGRDNTVKDTYNNLMANGECVVHAVTFDMLEQMNLASSELPAETDEFEIAGFTAIASDIVQPFRVKESPFQLECKMIQMISFSDKPGAGNLALCEVLRIHVDESILHEGVIHPDLIDLVGRNGGNWYTRSFGSALFELPKPTHSNPVGYHNLPECFLKSNIFSANNLGLLASAEKLPDNLEIQDFIKDYPVLECDEVSFNRFNNIGDYERMLQAAKYFSSVNHPKTKYFIELTAKSALDARDLYFGLHTASLLCIV